MSGVKINYDIVGEKGSEECFTFEAIEILLTQIKACEEIIGEKAKIELEFCE